MATSVLKIEIVVRFVEHWPKEFQLSMEFRHNDWINDARLDDWVDKLVLWKAKRLKNIHFFVHQNIELESPLLFVYFIKNLNRK